MNAITIAHLSDIHYNPGDTSPTATMLRDKGIFVEELLPLCLKTLKERKPDILLITGDLVHESDAGAYQYIKSEITYALPDTPVLCTMGNHDVRGAFRQGFLNEHISDQPYYASLLIKGYQFISLDSSWEKGLEGILTDEAMDYLEEKLEMSENCSAILLTHHPILAAARHLGLTINERFAKILKSGKIKALFNGHVHGCYTRTVYGVPQFTAESLKTDFDLLHDRLSYHDQSGFQIVSFDENGDWLTERFIQHPKTEIFFENAF